MLTSMNFLTNNSRRVKACRWEAIKERCSLEIILVILGKLLVIKLTAKSNIHRLMIMETIFDFHEHSKIMDMVDFFLTDCELCIMI